MNVSAARTRWRCGQQELEIGRTERYHRLLSFNQFFDNIQRQLKALALQGQKLSKARDLLLPRLMNGEIEVWIVKGEG